MFIRRLRTVGLIAGMCGLGVGLGLASAPPPAGAATPQVEPRLLVQQGLATALALNAGLSQAQFLALTTGIHTSCTALPGGGGGRLVSLKPQSLNQVTATVDLYYDGRCQAMASQITGTVTNRSTWSAVAFQLQSDTLSYGPTGTWLGTLTLDVATTLSKQGAAFSGIGAWIPASGAARAQVGLACAFNTTSGGPCTGAVVQSLARFQLDFAALTQVSFQLASTAGGQALSLTNTTAQLMTGPLGSLSIVAPSPSTLAIAGGPTTPVGAISLAGAAALFSLFPPAPTAWSVSDAKHGQSFAMAQGAGTQGGGASGTWTGTVVRTATKATLATLTLDRSGTGMVHYADGTHAVVTHWVAVE